MPAPNKDGKILAYFNVKNAVYNIEGTEEIKPCTWMNTFAKDRNVTVLPLYGDGEVQVSLASDKNVSGKIGMTARDEEFEKDLGLTVIMQDGSTAEVAITSMKRVNFGYQTEFVGKNGIVKVKKVWVLNAQVSPPNESLTQTQDNISQSTVEYNYTGYGVNAKAASGEGDYIDSETGNPVRAYTVSKKPGEDGYDNFLDSVPKPRIKAPTQ